MSTEDIDIYLEDELFQGIDEQFMLKHKDAEKQCVIDGRVDVIAQIMAMYPTTRTHILARRFGVSESTINRIAKAANLKRQERRGGHNRKTVEMINLDGYVVKVFKSLAEFAETYGLNLRTTQYNVKNGKGNLIPGYLARYRQ